MRLKKHLGRRACERRQRHRPRTDARLRAEPADLLHHHGGVREGDRHHREPAERRQCGEERGGQHRRGDPARRRNHHRQSRRRSCALCARTSSDCTRSVPKTAVVVAADKGAPTGVLVNVIDQVRQGGVQNVSIAAVGGLKSAVEDVTLPRNGRDRHRPRADARLRHEPADLFHHHDLVRRKRPASPSRSRRR